MIIFNDNSFIIPAVTLVLVSFAFLKIRMAKFKQSLIKTRYTVFFIMLFAIAIGTEAWMKQNENEIIAAFIYGISVVVLVITAMFVWRDYSRDVNSQNKTEKHPYLDESYIALFSKESTRNWQLLALAYMGAFFFMWYFFASNDFMHSGDIPEIVWSLWVVMLISCIGLTAQIVAKVESQKEEPALRKLLKIVWTYLYSLSGLGDAAVIQAMYSNGDEVLRNRRLVHQDRKLLRKLILGVVSWLIWGVLCGALIGLTNHQSLMPYVLFPGVFLPILLLAMARFHGLFP